MRKEPLEEDLDYIARYPLQYEQLKDTTVLVTGATGLIGVSIVRALIAIGNIHVIALVRNIENWSGCTCSEGCADNSIYCYQC